jgi:hypothetical protein
LSHYSQMAIDAIAEAAQADASRLAARVIGGAL